jgi:methyl-accepting chemotaxis protein
MKWFLNLATRTKLFAGLGAMLALLGVTAATAFVSVQRLQASQARLYEHEFAISTTLKDLRTNQNGVRAALLTVMLARRAEDREAARQELQARVQEVDKLMTRLLELGKDEPGFSARMEEFRSLRLAYRRTRDEEVLPLMEAGKTEQALGLILGVQADRDNKLRTIARELGDQAEERTRLAVAAGDRSVRQTLQTFAVLSGVALALAVIVAYGLNRIIASPLREVSRAAERVAAGDLTGNLSLDCRKDEVGILAATFQQMLDNLRQMTQEIKEGINVLASAASEILAGTTQVAAGASESAAAVSETTSTVEEVKQTAHVSSQKARYVSETAQKSAQVSQGGQKSVEDTIEGMNRIRKHMQSIAESIVRLSEQSQAIGEIIATVNNLADQSNLLAVNAAIEAAKAGEHGRGFAVVAQEVRSLAEQSKQATAQVRSLLGDIQKATSAAVMATEQGSKSVEAGVKQSAQAGEAVCKLAESIAEAAQAATQIAASSQQQLVGMDQVVQAMENIKQATSQSVTSTAQVETAARNLNDVGQKLKALVTHYRL